MTCAHVRMFDLGQKKKRKERRMCFFLRALSFLLPLSHITSSPMNARECAKRKVDLVCRRRIGIMLFADKLLFAIIRKKRRGVILSFFFIPPWSCAASAPPSPPSGASASASASSSSSCRAASSAAPASRPSWAAASSPEALRGGRQGRRSAGTGCARPGPAKKGGAGA